jgi:hypothetical protein
METGQPLSNAILQILCNQLNQLFQNDPNCVKDLFSHKAYVNNDWIAMESPFVVGSDMRGEYLRVIGLLNGLFGTETHRLATTHDDSDNSIIGFEIMSK